MQSRERCSRKSVSGILHIRVLQGGLTGPSPVDRARNGSKHHLLVDATRVLLAVAPTSGTSPPAHPLNPYWDAATTRRGQAA